MVTVLDIRKDTLPVYHTVGVVEIESYWVEMGRLVGTHRPIAISWRAQQAWIAESAAPECWAEMADAVREALTAKEVCDAD